jgi:hypothetical protein
MFRLKRTIHLLFVSLLMIPCPLWPIDFPQIEGWKPHREVLTFNAANLWKHINGAAEFYLAYDFWELRVQDIASESIPGLIVTVNIYDQRTPLNAFGIYSTERPDNTEKHSLGTEGVVSPPYQCLLLKDRFFVKIEAFEGEIDEKTGKALLASVAKALSGSENMPAEIELLPKSGNMVIGSEGFTKSVFLGLEELNNCVHAKYNGKKTNGVYDVFLMLPESGKSLDEIWEQLAAIWKGIRHNGRSILFREVPYQGFVGIIRLDNRLLGISRSKSAIEMGRRFDTILSGPNVGVR